MGAAIRGGVGLIRIRVQVAEVAEIAAINEILGGRFRARIRTGTILGEVRAGKI